MQDRDEQLLNYATARQAEQLRTWWSTGSIDAAAAAMGIHRSNFGRTLKAVQARAARKGYAPGHDMTHTVPDGFAIKGVSTYYNAEGKPTGQWVKTNQDAERQLELLREAVAALRDDVPRAAPIPAPPQAMTTSAAASMLCNLFTITDYHVGMLAWDKEGGADWDLRIAEDTLAAAMQHLVRTAPRARVAVVNQLGDFLHFDGLEAVTPTHRHVLDADSRFRKVIGAAIRILRGVIDAALATHDEVHVVMAEGNHDLASSAWLQQLFAALYENEPRVTVNDAALPYYVFQHGRVMLGFHHGHLKKNDGLPLHFAASYPAIWGETVKRYIHVGHRHHVEEKEHAGVKVVQHSTLAARDAHASRGGWHSDRQAIAITYHQDHGEVARCTVTPAMLSE